MGHHARAGLYEAEEPRFEPPPSFGARVERRLSVRAAAAWAVRGSDDFQAGPIDTNEASIVISGAGAIEIDRVGAAIAATFGLRAGPLRATEPYSLGRRIVEIATVSDGSPMLPVMFDGVIRGAGDPPATLLVRGVVLALDDHRARIVVSWKEAVSTQQNRAIHDELRRVIAKRAPETAANDPFAPLATNVWL